MHSPPPALRITHAIQSKSLGVMFEVASLRSPHFILRSTDYRKLIVDERILTHAHQLVVQPQRLMAMVLLEGALTVYCDPPLQLTAGDAVGMDARDLAKVRFDRAVFLDLEWPDTEARRWARPTRLRPVDLKQAQAVCQALSQPTETEPATLTLALELFESIGAAPPTAEALSSSWSGPSPLDQRLARAMAEQACGLATKASTSALADSAQVSVRQLQRLIEAFNARYGFNGLNWRDTRNRWRLQFAVLLLSRDELSVAEVARDVGFASPNALTRALAAKKLPPPGEIRRLLRGGLSDNDPLSEKQ